MAHFLESPVSEARAGAGSSVSFDGNTEAPARNGIAQSTHARSYWLLLAEGHLNRKLFGEMLGRIWALPVPGGQRRRVRTRQRTRVAEGRRGRAVAKSPLRLLKRRNRAAFDDRSSSERSPNGEVVRKPWRPVDRLPCACQDGQKGNPG